MRLEVNATASVWWVPIASIVTCVYVRRNELRGDVFLLIVLLGYTAAAVEYYYLAGQAVVESLIYATGVTALYLGFATLLAVAYRASPSHPLASYPGPIANKISSIPIAIAAASGRRHAYVAEMHKKYGTFVRVAPNKLSINSADAIHPIYASSQAFDKSENYRPGRTHDGSIFFMRDRVEHGHRRRMWSSAFTPAAIKAGNEMLDERTRQLVECIVRRSDDSGVVNIGHCIDHWSFDMMGDFTFGGSNRIEFMQDGDPTHALRSSQKSIIMYEIFGEIPSLFDVLSLLPVTDEFRALDKLADMLLDIRKKISPKNASDLCSLFLAQGDDHPYPPLDEKDLRADTVFAIAAGSDTIAAMLTIILFYLINNPSTYHTLATELDTHFPTGDIPASAHAQISELPYLTAVINEGLRVGSPFPGFPRVVPPSGAMLAGRFVPGGTIVAVPTYTQHMSPDNFAPRPEKFAPERWLPDGLGPGTVTRKEALMSFQFGPFGCLGKPLALRQLAVVISTLLLAYDLEFAPGFSSQAFFDGWTNYRTNVLKYPLTVKAKPRKH